LWAVLVLAFIAGIAVGGVIAWILGRRAGADADHELRRLTADVARLEVALESERNAVAEKVALLADAKKELSDAFKALSADALKDNNSSFLELARSELAQMHLKARAELTEREKAVEHLVKPISESLQKVDGQIRNLEQTRREAYGALTEQVRALADGQTRLQGETANLVTALRAPVVRGRWGEIQLRRVVEMAGMIAHCDFVEQASVNVDGRVSRPDVVVKLPGEKNVVVDAKAPLQAYLNALEAPDEDARQTALRDHARQIRDHITKLSAKSYWEQFDSTPEFVVLFLPGETFFSAALEQDPSLIEEGVNQRVILATPTTLIALLRAVAYGWRQEKVAESARVVSELGRELHQRVATLADHFATLGKRLDGAVQAYNQTLGSLERRVLVTTRRFADHGAAPMRQIDSPDPIERSAQQLNAAELLPGNDDVVAEADAA
jgi:DNA recombination protein RmuC